MKTLAVLGFLSFVGFGVHQAVNTPMTVEAASKAVTNTQADVKDAASMTGAYAYQVGKALDAPDRATELPEKLREFHNSTELLSALRSRLRNDIDAYQAAYTRKLADFDEERSVIQDERTARNMLTLRRRTEEDLQQRLANAKATLDELEQVLAKGSDLTHASNCVIIASDLHTQGEEIDSTLRQAKQEAASYAVTTNNLLGKITAALTE